MLQLALVHKAEDHLALHVQSGCAPHSIHVFEARGVLGLLKLPATLRQS